MNKRGLDKLRRKAEENLAANNQKIKGIDKADLATMAHELAVHQVELEIQNEELLESRALVEETRDRYQELFDFAPVGYFTLDEHNRIVEANLTGYQLLKTDKGTLKNKIFTRFIADGETDNFYLHRKKALETELRQNFILKMKKDDGTLFYAQLDIIKATGEKLRLAVSDITEEWKKGEEAQRQSEENYRTLFNSIDEGFCVIQVIFDSRNKPLDYRFLEINPAFERQTGLHDAEGKLMRSLAPEHEEHWFQIYGRIALTGESERFVNEAKALNRWYDVYAFRVGEPESRKVAILFNDITARKKAEDDLAKANDELEIKVRERTAELSASEEKYRTLVKSIPDEVWFADINKNFTLTNPAALRTFGDAAAGIEVEALAKSLEVYCPDGTIRPVEEAPPLRALQGETILGQEEIVITPVSGELRYRRVSAAPVKDSGGKIIGSVSVVRDVTESKKMEDQLRQRAEELETVMNVVPAAIWVAHDPACHNITGNQTANRFYEAEEGENVSAGPAPGEPVPERRFFRNGKELTAEELPMQEAAARNVDIQGSEFNVVMPSGKSRTLWGSASPLRNDDGQVRGVVAAFVDITDRTQEQEKLKESENRFSKAFHSSPVALSISRINDGTFIDVNQSFLNMYGYKREEIIGQKATDLNIYDNPSERKEIVRQLEKQGKLLNYEVMARTKTGTEINALTSAEKIEINGQAHIIWTTIDITDRKKAEKAVRESEEKFSKIFHSSPVGMVMTHLPEGQCVDVNEAYLTMLEYSRENVIGRDSRDLNMHIDPDKRAEVFRTLHEQGKVTNIELSFRTKTGRVIEILSSIDRINLQGQEYSLSTNIDITQRKQDEAEIKQLNRELKAINECDQVIVHANDEQTLLSDVCHILCTSAGYRTAWVSSVERDEAKSVRPLAWCGDEEYITNARITWADNERGRGPTGLAARNNKTYFFQDFTSDPAAAPWREAALLRGFRSSIALPLADEDGNVFEVLTLYSTEPNYFNAAEVKLLEMLAGDLAFGINGLREREKRKSAESEILHLASFPELNPNPVLEVEPDGKVVYANPTAKTHFPLMTQGLKHQFLMDFINSMKKMGTDSFTKDVKIGDSWYEEMLALVASTKNYMLYARDITARKNAELMLQETRDYLNNLLNYANAPIIVWDPLFHITQFNHAFERLTGRAAEDVIGNHLEILFPEEQREHSMEHIRRAVSGERMEGEEILIQNKDGSVRTVLWNSATLYDQDNKSPLATIAQGQDITERKKAEDELKQRTMDLQASNKELEAFSYSVSHDLRAPLRSITGFSAVLLEDYIDELDNEGKSYLKKISDSGELMGQLMDDLLKLSRVTRSDLDMEKLDISNMARKIVSDLAKDEPKRKVKVTIAPNMTANGDKNLLGLVLQNLLGNAWKYTSKTLEPRIEMGTVEHIGKQAYFVRDNGVGFDMTYANKLFQPFQRLHKATEFAGTGIGLATVQRIIRRHGGEVWAEAKVGEGATFYFTLN
jgi:PAS domain S-box-containing protein